MKRVLFLSLLFASLNSLAVNPAKFVDGVAKLLGSEAATSFGVISKSLGGDGNGIGPVEIAKLKGIVGEGEDLSKISDLVAKSDLTDEEVSLVFSTISRLSAKYDVDSSVLACRVCVTPEARAKGIEVLFNEFPVRAGSNAADQFSTLKKLSKVDVEKRVSSELGISISEARKLGEEDVENALILAAFKAGGNPAESRVAEAILGLGSTKNHRLVQMLLDGSTDTKSALAFEKVLIDIKPNVKNGDVKKAFYGYTEQAIKDAEDAGKTVKAKKMRELEAEMKRKNCFFKS